METTVHFVVRYNRLCRPCRGHPLPHRLEDQRESQTRHQVLVRQPPADCGIFRLFYVSVFFSVFRIRIMLMRIRIRGSASGMMDPDPDPTLNRTNSNFFLLNFFCIRFKTQRCFCCCTFELIIRVY